MSESNIPRQYKDVSGNPTSLRWLVLNEPEWAENQIRHRDQLELTAADLREQLAEALKERDEARRVAGLLASGINHLIPLADTRYTPTQCPSCKSAKEALAEFAKLGK